MKFIYLALFSSLFLSVIGRAQFVQEIEGEYFGKNITQTDLDILFVNNPNLYWLNFDYKDTSLIIPDFKKLAILAIQSEVLQTMVFPDTLLELGLIDFNLPSLTTLSEPVLPNLYQLTLYANLSSLPQLICTSEGLTLVDIKNYKDISWPECMEDRFLNGPFELSSCEIFDGKDGPTVSKIVSPDNAPDEWLESSDDMSEEELEDLQKGMQRSGRMITVIRRATGFALAGIVFLILKS
jgi:hypothetical protein